MKKCMICGHAMRTERVKDYRYAIGGLKTVRLDGVDRSECPNCGEVEVGIARIEAVHQAIAHALIKRRRRLAPTEVRFLREYLGWSGTEFAKHMGVTRHQVSRWENGAPLSALADHLLRAFILLKEPTESYSIDDFARIPAGPVKSAPKPSTIRLERTSKEEWRDVLN